MAFQLAVADVERLVVDQQADDLAVRDVQDRLAGLGVAVPGLGVGEGAHLVEPVEVGAGDPVRLALVEIPPQADVPVRQGEDGLRLRDPLEVQVGLLDRPGLEVEQGVDDHGFR